MRPTCVFVLGNRALARCVLLGGDALLVRPLDPIRVGDALERDRGDLDVLALDAAADIPLDLVFDRFVLRQELLVRMAGEDAPSGALELWRNDLFVVVAPDPA